MGVTEAKTRAVGEPAQALAIERVRVVDRLRGAAGQPFPERARGVARSENVNGQDRDARYRRRKREFCAARSPEETRMLGTLLTVHSDRESTSVSPDSWP